MTYISWIFDLPLINSSRYLLFGVYFSLHQKNTVCKYQLQRKSILNEEQRDIHFHFVSDTDFQKFWVFLVL